MPPLKILFIDDETYRCREFHVANLMHDVTYATDFDTAKQWLSYPICKFDVIHFDHDFIEEDYARYEIVESLAQYKELGAISGGLLAEHIAQAPDKFKHVKFYFHSLNKIGVAYMREVLGSAGLNLHPVYACWTEQVKRRS